MEKDWGMARFIDLTLKVTPEMVEKAQGNSNKALAGHIGTHFDVMDKEFPLDYLERDGIVFDVIEAMDREICESDIDLGMVENGMFVAFCTGFVDKLGYGGMEYFSEHPQLSYSLIEALVEKGISIIGIDFAGVRRGKEHTPKDQYCADRGIFIVENLCNLDSILKGRPCGEFVANTYPVKYSGMTGLPCRVVAKI